MHRAITASGFWLTRYQIHTTFMKLSPAIQHSGLVPHTVTGIRGSHATHTNLALPSDTASSAHLAAAVCAASVQAQSTQRAPKQWRPQRLRSISPSLKLSAEPIAVTTTMLRSSRRAALRESCLTHVTRDATPV
eukprot:3935828-Rhodomonas_salina.5